MPAWKAVVGVVAALGFFSAGLQLSRTLEARNPSRHATGAFDLLYLPTPQQARFMALGFNQVVADYYWVRGLQYFTDPVESRNQYKNLSDFLELVVGLDPDYEFAYKFAGIAVPYDTGRFNYVNTRRSTSFLERGVERFPDNWQLRFYLGYNYLNYHHEPLTAAKHFAIASKLPGAPAYLGPFAARVYTAGGEVELALEFAQAAYDNATDPETKQMMRGRLLEVKMEVELRRIEAGAKQFAGAHGRLPASIEELVRDGFSPAPPGFTLDDKGVAHPPKGMQRLVIHKDDSETMRGE